jgi:hypothetical protein
MRQANSQKGTEMGLFWDLYQQSQISDQGQRSGAIEQRVAYLEAELRRTQVMLHQLIGVLETHLGKDLDGDGRTG